MHHCYVRATVGGERLPAFSMMVRKPDEGDPLVASRIRAGSQAYTTPVKDIDVLEIDSRDLVQKYREGLHALRSAEEVEETNAADTPKQRTRHHSGQRDSANAEAGHTVEEAIPSAREE